MLKVGVPEHVVHAKMRLQGLDPSALQAAPVATEVTDAALTPAAAEGHLSQAMLRQSLRLRGGTVPSERAGSSSASATAASFDVASGSARCAPVFAPVIIPSSQTRASAVVAPIWSVCSETEDEKEAPACTSMVPAAGCATLSDVRPPSVDSVLALAKMFQPAAPRITQVHQPPTAARGVGALATSSAGRSAPGGLLAAATTASHTARAAGATRAPARVSLLDMKRATTAGVALGKLRLPAGVLARALQTLCPVVEGDSSSDAVECGGGAALMKRVVIQPAQWQLVFEQLRPTEAEAALISQYVAKEGGGTKLAEVCACDAWRVTTFSTQEQRLALCVARMQVESFFVVIMAVPAWHARLQLMHLRSQLPQQVANANAHVAVLKRACAVACSSAQLHRIVHAAVQLFEALQLQGAVVLGSEPGCGAAFQERMACLCKLGSVKSEGSRGATAAALL
ncbi:MAG: hypothetical protein EOO41_03815, partial [Methanobacteriota archaeon]